MALNSGVRRCLDIVSNDLARIEPNWACEAVFAHLLIYLNDSLRLLDFAGHRLTFTNDLPDGVDVSSQVKFLRDAMCHIGSGRREVDEFKNRLMFGFQIGKGVLMRSHDKTLECPYEDDQAIFMGHHRLLVRRHIHRCVTDANEMGPRIAQQHGVYWHPI